MNAHPHSAVCGCDHLTDDDIEDRRQQDEDDYWAGLAQEELLYEDGQSSLDDDGPSLDDVEIDHCTCCGRAFGWTEALRELWIQKWNPGPNERQPQHCSRCLNLETNEDEGFEEAGEDEDSE